MPFASSFYAFLGRPFLLVALGLVMGIAMLSPLAQACEDRWITAIHPCGESVQLDDESQWTVETFDRYKIGQWKVGDHVDVCGHQQALRNLTRNEHVVVKAKDVMNYEEKHAACDRRF